jgi:hypothetical protein
MGPKKPSIRETPLRFLKKDLHKNFNNRISAVKKYLAPHERLSRLHARRRKSLAWSRLGKVFHGGQQALATLFFLFKRRSFFKKAMYFFKTCSPCLREAKGHGKTLPVRLHARRRKSLAWSRESLPMSLRFAKTRGTGQPHKIFIWLESLPLRSLSLKKKREGLSFLGKNTFFFN